MWLNELLVVGDTPTTTGLFMVLKFPFVPSPSISVMTSVKKDKAAILKKLGIQELNQMQQDAFSAIQSLDNVVLLSPTGTGKTLAFLLPLIEQLDPKNQQVQLLILAPSRELAIQIEQVTREMGSGFKANVIYGGRAIAKDFIDLEPPPRILIGTPGRLADHMSRETFSVEHIKAIVLDEFDKSLEIGYEEEMEFILTDIPNLQKRILTSATNMIDIPAFGGLDSPQTISYLDKGLAKLEVRKVISPEKDKLQILLKTLCHIGNQPGIIFCNFKDSIQRVSDFLSEKNIRHGTFYGGMEQKERERALIKFRNGTHQILLATDLAARGIDVPEIGYIIHYHLPLREQEFTHRNGRTARMNRDGQAYILVWKEDELPDFLLDLKEEILEEKPIPVSSSWRTVFISGGRKDKISKGDIAGLFFKQAMLTKDELGVIELKQDCAFIAVHKSKVKQVIQKLNNSKIKKRKLRVYQI